MLDALLLQDRVSEFAEEVWARVVDIGYLFIQFESIFYSLAHV